MRRLLVLLVVPLLAVVVGAAPADAGGSSDVTIVKAVDGDLPVGAEFVIQFRCRSILDDPNSEFVEEEVTFNGADSAQFVSGSFAYCIVEEVQTSGADSVSYACEASGGASCTTNQIVDITDEGGGTETVVLTVTNGYGPEPTTTTDSTTSSTAATSTTAGSAPAVAVSPTFTG